MKNYRLIGLSVCAASLFAFASLEGCTATVTDGNTDGGTDTDGAAGTSGTSGTSGTAGSGGDGGTDSASGPRGTGFVLARYSEFGTTKSFFLTASFSAPTTASGSTGCTTTVEGDCKVTDCTITPSDASTTTDGGIVEPPNAGDIKLTGGGFPSMGVTTSPNTDADAGALKGTYTAQTLSATEPWNATSKDMTVTAVGATVPAFTKDLVAPLIVTATAPAFATTATALPRANDLTVSWTGGMGSGGKVQFELLHSSTTRSVSATCEFDPAGGTGTVKAAVLAKFPAGATASGSIDTVSAATVAAGNYDVSIKLESGGKAGTASANGMFSIP